MTTVGVADRRLTLLHDASIADYLEPHLVSMSPDAVSALKGSAWFGRLPAASGLVNSTVAREGREALQRALCDAADRARDLGVRDLIFAAGRPRELFLVERDPTIAFRRFLADMTPHLAEAGVRLLLEPLCVAETGFINSLSQAYACIAGLPPDVFGLVYDLFHARADADTWTAHSVSERSLVAEVHLAGARRELPDLLCDDWLGTQVRAIVTSGFKGRLCIEASEAQSADVAAVRRSVEATRAYVLELRRD